MIDLLLNALCPTVADVEPYVRNLCGNINLGDAKSCCRCSPKVGYECDETILKVNSTEPIAVIDIEKIVGQDFGNVCDTILYGESEHCRQFVLCELTCSSVNHFNPNEQDVHPEGKRAYAYSQLTHTLDRLLQNEKVNVSILTCQEKHLIIGWRERKGSSPLVGVQNKAMEVFLNNIPVEHAQHVKTPEVQHGFDLVIVKYPKPYKWSLG